MKSRSPLALMEQLIMLLVFALAAALCVQAFVLSEHISQNAADRDRAMQLAQNAAELMKSSGGSVDEAKSAAMEQMDESCWYADPGQDWTDAPEGRACDYMLVVREGGARPGLCSADLEVLSTRMESLAKLRVAWQEVDGDA